MQYKQLIVLGLSLGVVSILSGFMPSRQDHKAKNLQILPKDINHEELDKIMDNFKVALGVKCSHCHATKKDDPKKLDFASDEKPEKEIARNMMRMTSKINKRYFGRVHEDGSMTNISCITCHNGKAQPQLN
ncbi:c-type cytochrome [Olivibacter sp. CPCC 100613]|uniref:c-type cytochrome n=1 Tax=Olivibacter sp. CPCC 100613 TaxID=3079931 RepID=UPI002FFB87F6